MDEAKGVSLFLSTFSFLPLSPNLHTNVPQERAGKQATAETKYLPHFEFQNA